LKKPSIKSKENPENNENSIQDNSLLKKPSIKSKENAAFSNENRINGLDLEIRQSTEKLPRILKEYLKENQENYGKIVEDFVKNLEFEISHIEEKNSFLDSLDLGSNYQNNHTFAKKKLDFKEKKQEEISSNLLMKYQKKSEGKNPDNLGKNHENLLMKNHENLLMGNMGDLKEKRVLEEIIGYESGENSDENENFWKKTAIIKDNKPFSANNGRIKEKEEFITKALHTENVINQRKNIEKTRKNEKFEKFEKKTKEKRNFSMEIQNISENKRNINENKRNFNENNSKFKKKLFDNIKKSKDFRKKPAISNEKTDQKLRVFYDKFHKLRFFYGF